MAGFIWFLNRDVSSINYSKEEIKFLQEQGFFEKSQDVANLKPKTMVEQNLDSREESFEILATKFNKKDKQYEMAFKLENKTSNPKTFYLIPVSKTIQMSFEKITGLVNNQSNFLISKEDIINSRLEELYDVGKHKQELKPELANAYNDMENNGYKPDPVKVVLDANSVLLAKAEWQFNQSQSLNAVDPVYLLVQGSAAGVMDEITILNVHSSPQQGENWEVSFTTKGIADLKIIPNDQATVDDDEFTGLYCGEEKREPQILDGDVIYYPAWQCEGIAKVIHYTLVAGKHTLRFEFGDAAAFAYNATFTKQFIIGGSVDDPATTGTEYVNLMGDAHNVLWNSTETDVESVIPTAGTLSNFQVSLQTASGAGKSWTFTIRKTNQDTTLSVSLANTTLSSVDSDSVAVAAGDKIAMSATGTGTPAAAARVSWTVQFTPTTTGETILLSNAGGSVNFTSTFATLIGSTYGGSSSEFNAQILFPTAGTLKKFYVELTVAPGGATSRTFTIAKNGVEEVFAVTISGVATTNSNTSNTTSVVAGDKVSIHAAVGGSPAATKVKFGIVFAPTTSGEWIASDASDDTLAGANGTEYQQITGGESTLTATETEQYGLSQATTAKAIYVETSADAGVGGDNYAFAFRQNGGASSPALGCNITASTTTCTAAADVTVNANDLLDTSITGSSAPAGIGVPKIAYLFYNAPWEVNNNPTISLVEDGPDPVTAGSTVALSANWSDADAEGVKLYVCKAADGTTSGCGVGGTWCSYTASYNTTTPLSCNYTTTSADIGAKNYYVYVCDVAPSCSAAAAGVFNVVSATPTALIFQGNTIFDFCGILGGTGNIQCTGSGPADYTADPSWTKVADTTVRDIAGDYNATVAKDIYCDSYACILYTDGQVPPLELSFSDSKLYANIIWSKTDSSTGITWGPVSSIAGGDIGGTHGNINVGNDPDNVNGLNWLAINYTSAEGTYPAMDLCKAKGPGWRLPNILELDSIRDQGKGSAPYTYLPGIASGTYWPSTEYNFINAFSLDLTTGSVVSTNKPGSLYVRCARGR